MKSRLALILIFLTATAHAENFILPKSFSVDKNDLPKVEKNIEPITTPATPAAPITPVTTVIPVSPDIKQNKSVIKADSLANLIRNYQYDYESTFNSTLSALVQFNIIPVEYDTTRGQIRARLASGKELFILLLPSNEKMTHVRITPADGNYNISLEKVNEIFKAIDKRLNNGV